jgi:hypothetical protein
MKGVNCPYSVLLVVGLLTGMSIPARALPPENEIPEEVLRTRVITTARSPIDGEPLTAAEYADLQAQLSDPNTRESVNPDVAQVIFLLQVRRVLKPILPFIP